MLISRTLSESRSQAYGELLLLGILPIALFVWLLVDGTLALWLRSLGIGVCLSLLNFLGLKYAGRWLVRFAAGSNTQGPGKTTTLVLFSARYFVFVAVLFILLVVCKFDSAWLLGGLGLSLAINLTRQSILFRISLK